LPDKLAEPVACHHDPRLAGDHQMAAAIIHFSNIMIRGLGYGHGDDVWVPPLSQRAWRLLGFTPQDVDQVIGEVEEKLWDVKGFTLDVKAQLQAEMP
ncbi:MAG TPA: hypothetical protein VNT26_22815, partial [Candidatus Sulfotelmatobacter sp.]|nr:hypothetical protein [Candidatus Sulfotelmatobacter sp.]